MLGGRLPQSLRQARGTIRRRRKTSALSATGTRTAVAQSPAARALTTWGKQDRFSLRSVRDRGSLRRRNGAAMMRLGELYDVDP